MLIVQAFLPGISAVLMSLVSVDTDRIKTKFSIVPDYEDSAGSSGVIHGMGIWGQREAQGQ